MKAVHVVWIHCVRRAMVRSHRQVNAEVGVYGVHVSGIVEVVVVVLVQGWVVQHVRGAVIHYQLGGVRLWTSVF